MGTAFALIVIAFIYWKTPEAASIDYKLGLIAGSLLAMAAFYLTHRWVPVFLNWFYGGSNAG